MIAAAANEKTPGHINQRIQISTGEKVLVKKLIFNQGNSVRQLGALGAAATEEVGAA